MQRNRNPSDRRICLFEEKAGLKSPKNQVKDMYWRFQSEDLRKMLDSKLSRTDKRPNANSKRDNMDTFKESSPLKLPILNKNSSIVNESDLFSD